MITGEQRSRNSDIRRMLDKGLRSKDFEHTEKTQLQKTTEYKPLKA